MQTMRPTCKQCGLPSLIISCQCCNNTKSPKWLEKTLTQVVVRAVYTVVICVIYVFHWFFCDYRTAAIMFVSGLLRNSTRACSLWSCHLSSWQSFLWQPMIRLGGWWRISLFDAHTISLDMNTIYSLRPTQYLFYAHTISLKAHTFPLLKHTQFLF